MKDVILQRIGYNVPEFKRIHFSGTRKVHSFIYFQGPVLLHGKKEDNGACIVYPKGYEHDYVTLDNFSNSYIGFWGPDDVFSSLPIKLGKPIYPVNCGEINDILRRICVENSERRIAYSEQIQALITALLVAISRGTAAENRKDKNIDIRNKLTALRARYLSDVLNVPDIDEIIMSSGLSRSRFYRLYAEFFGVSPKEDLIRVRLDKAREIIRSDPDITVCSVAIVCGFTDPPYFSHQFKQRYGYTPKNYALACKTENDK